MAFPYHQTNLPVKDIIPEVHQVLENQNTLILKAPPGAGKSTLLPLALLGQKWLGDQKILMLEPRRLAAKSIAERMSDMLGEKVGNTVGYRVRFDTKISDKTKIEVVTEGILTRMIHHDNTLEDVGIIIFDEFHERSIHADVAMALSREIQKVIREDLRILVMSATMDMPQLSLMLDQAPIIESKGKMYPVDINYVGDIDRYLIPELTAKTVIDAAKKHDGDILCFLPGQGEIRKCEEILRGALREFSIHPLYGQLPFHVQQKAIFPHPQGKRKVVLATNIAETSLTIEGVKIVVDSGFTRTQVFDANSGLSKLTTEQISEDAADQRSGRAGRLSEGVCYRLWSLSTHQKLDKERTPEIEKADLTSLALDMAEWGITSPTSLEWVTPPPNGHFLQAMDTLEQLEAFEDGLLTDHGKEIHKLPCHPRIAHMLLYAEEEDLLALACDLAAILEERDPLPNNSGIDINLRIEALRRFRTDSGKNKRFRNIEKVANQYRRLFDIDADNSGVDDFETGVLLAHAYPERIACSKPGNNAQFQLANGKIAMAGHKDDLAYEQWLAVAHIDAREGMGKIFMASPLDPKDLATMVKEKEMIEWDTDDGGLIATKDLRIGSIVLKSTPIQSISEEAKLNAITDAIKKEGRQLLDFNEEVTQWQARIASLRKWNPKEEWPDCSTPHLLLNNKQWITPYLKDVKKPQDLKKLKLIDILHHSLEWDKQEALNTLAPIKIKVPSGSQIKLKYSDNGAPPILAVRLQECFGLAETPSVNNCKQNVLMHLLSPGFKPVQITSDLKSFWDNTYFEVKKELKRRYPKHAWPEKPWEEEAVRGVKRK
ncbi:ATP-dependent helicase HrpB [Flammeovirga yaeyamensis]|uniref:ATP-dependent helicase HrpB n=1 Tax=Flammeovirga yaeyamensis TaxID=367791 RepID=A0AAX1NAT2_9BACT|nr:ATP-dependent helicase HrpB [Flammeovirga yaeyamensis]MBB3699982.1 ATP-dependent helicase HrpB [Flammeovirga yaeyamensis]NMF37579.1 ATP-dependent helicase HrpB [Flammeovirga yaeyamensis]QWG04636.1 ATP-dependent helicase HrpB [Flammeovirga yaeyamensis]